MYAIESPYESLAVDFMNHLAWVFSVRRQTQFMQVLISERHAVIRSACAQLPFVSVNNDTCCSVVIALGKMALLWLIGRLCVRWSCFSSNTKGLQITLYFLGIVILEGNV